MSAQPSAVDMRHTKLKAEEAALLAGELVKPSWASRNEGIHERVSFEDTLWGFEMAGGAYYNTPLRITYVKPGSRAEQACIRMGDTVLRIQGIDTSTLTLQEAHELVKDAGINLKIVVTSPDDLRDAHYEYQDSLQVDGGLTAEQLRALERERIQKAIAKAIRCRDFEWPWCRRKFIIYRESNCFMVPSKYENKHRDQFPEQPSQRFSFFSTTDTERVKPTRKQNGDINSSKDEHEESAKLGEIEKEKIEEEEVVTDDEVEQDISNDVGVENNLGDNDHEPEVSERLQDEESTDELSSHEELSRSNQEEVTDNGEAEIENEELSVENATRKDSQGSSNYDLDSNNNHVNKNKKDSEENLDNDSDLDNKVINDIAGKYDESDIENEHSKMDEEIIDSVLSDNETDTLNER